MYQQPNADIRTFLRAGVLLDGAFSLWVSLKVDKFDTYCFNAFQYLCQQFIDLDLKLDADADFWYNHSYALTESVFCRKKGDIINGNWIPEYMQKQSFAGVLQNRRS